MLALSVVLPTLNCVESVPSVLSSLQARPQLLFFSRVLSRIDYCNSLLAGITSDQTARLQRILSNSARLFFRKKRSEHVTPMLISLHWLPNKQRIEYRHWLSATLMVHCPLTYHTVSPRTLPTDPFDHLTNCSVSHVLT